MVSFKEYNYSFNVVIFSTHFLLAEAPVLAHGDITILYIIDSESDSCILSLMKFSLKTFNLNLYL